MELELPSRQKRSRSQPQVHTLYRMFDSDDNLIYIGLTNNPPGRFKQHSQDKSWWDSVKYIAVEQFSSRDELIAAERTAIETERPIHNVTFNRRIGPSSDQFALAI